MLAAQALISRLFKRFRLEDNGSIYDLFLAAGIPMSTFLSQCALEHPWFLHCAVLSPFLLLFPLQTSDIYSGSVRSLFT